MGMLCFCQLMRKMSTAAVIACSLLLCAAASNMTYAVPHQNECKSQADAQGCIGGGMNGCCYDQQSGRQVGCCGGHDVCQHGFHGWSCYGVGNRATCRSYGDCRDYGGCCYDDQLNLIGCCAGTDVSRSGYRGWSCYPSGPLV